MKSTVCTLLATFMLFTLYNCNQTGVSASAKKVTFTPQSYKDSTGLCDQNPCFHLDVNWVTAVCDDKNVAQIINDSLEHDLTNLLSGFSVNEASKSVTEAFANLRKDFDEQVAEQAKLPKKEQFIVRYEIESETKSGFSNSKVIGVERNSYFYTGGAHPNADISYFTFDALTGKAIELKDITTDPDALVKVVEDAIRKEFKIADNETMESAGFFIEEGATHVALPVNYQLTPTGIKFIYNQYEIAPYALGTVAFELPFSAVEKCIKLERLK